MRDYYTNTEADAGAFERHYREPPEDDRPTLAELLAEEAEWAESLEVWDREAEDEE